MRFKGKRTYGLIGYPVAHSFSPAMHNAAFSLLKINAEYKLFPLKEEELEGFLNNLSRSDICGLNVTVPYKEKVLDFVKLPPESEYLRQVGAVNTMARQDDAWLGFNTDISGFGRHLKENIDPRGRKVAILGAGGAGRAVAYAISRLGAGQVIVYDIDINKARGLVSMIKGLFIDTDIKYADTIQGLDILKQDLLINATPLGLKAGDPLLIKEEALHKNLFVYDLIYNPPETKLLAASRKAGAKSANGLGMLLYQGAEAFKIWTAQEPPLDMMRRALKEELARCQTRLP